jgi:predicted molibdopterin-dependent oxidoreductase YjgC
MEKSELRITKHPILEFEEKKVLSFTFDGSEFKGFEGDTIASALHASGIKVLRHSNEKNRPRGFYCAIGNCSSCLMKVNGKPNVRACIETIQEGMVVETQNGKGDLI